MTSYRPEVLAGSSTQWAWNTLRFATMTEATAYALDLSMRWWSVNETRVTETDDPVTASFIDSELKWLTPPDGDAA